MFRRATAAVVRPLAHQAKSVSWRAAVRFVPRTTVARTAAATRPSWSAVGARAWFSSDNIVPVDVPSLGDSITEGSVVDIVKSVGDWVDTDEVILTIETDKVSHDLRAPQGGYVEEILTEDGDVVEIGQVLLKLREGEPPEGHTAQSADTAPPPPPKQDAAPSKPQESVSKPQGSAQAAPAASSSSSSSSSSTSAASDGSAAATTSSRSETRVPMNRMRTRIAERLKESQNTAAMLTTFQEVDMSNLISMRNKHKDAFADKHGVKLGFMSPFIKASAAALQEVPAINAVIDGKDIVYRDYCDISVAVASPRGLVVPVVRNAESLSFADTEATLAQLAEKARNNTIALEDMAGGTFTISNGGVFGSMMGTPILNLPQSAILGMHATKMRPMVVDGEIKARPVMYLALTYDHRLIDGREAVTFLCSIRDKIEDPSRLLLDL